MKIIAILMAIAIVLFTFAPEVIVKSIDIIPLNYHDVISTPMAYALIPPNPFIISGLKPSSAPNPKDNDGEY